MISKSMLVFEVVVCVWFQSAGPCQMNDIFINGHGSNGASGEKGGNLFIKSAGVLCKPEYLLEKSS